MDIDWDSSRTATVAIDIKDESTVAYAIFWSETEQDHPINFGSTTVNEENGKSGEYEGIRIAIQQAAENGYESVRILLVDKNTVEFLNGKMSNWNEGDLPSDDHSSSIFTTLSNIDQYWDQIAVKFEQTTEESQEYQDALSFAKEL